MSLESAVPRRSKNRVTTAARPTGRTRRKRETTTRHGGQLWRGYALHTDLRHDPPACPPDLYICMPQRSHRYVAAGELLHPNMRADAPEARLPRPRTQLTAIT